MCFRRLYFLLRTLFPSFLPFNSFFFLAETQNAFNFLRVADGPTNFAQLCTRTVSFSSLYTIYLNVYYAYLCIYLISIYVHTYDRLFFLIWLVNFSIISIIWLESNHMVPETIPGINLNSFITCTFVIFVGID